MPRTVGSMQTSSFRRSGTLPRQQCLTCRSRGGRWPPHETNDLSRPGPAIQGLIGSLHEGRCLHAPKQGTEVSERKRHSATCHPSWLSTDHPVTRRSTVAPLRNTPTTPVHRLVSG